MKCNLPKFVKYQLRLGKLPMMELFEITPRPLFHQSPSLIIHQTSVADTPPILSINTPLHFESAQNYTDSGEITRGANAPSVILSINTPLHFESSQNYTDSGEIT
jgi:hypothetical protein